MQIKHAIQLSFIVLYYIAYAKKIMFVIITLHILLLNMYMLFCILISDG